MLILKSSNLIKIKYNGICDLPNKIFKKFLIKFVLNLLSLYKLFKSWDNYVVILRNSDSIYFL